MLHKSPRITNYFWPKSPMRLTMLDSAVLKRQVAGAEAFNDHDEDGLHNLCGVIDACKVNQKYSSMIDKLEIPDISASEALMILRSGGPTGGRKATSMDRPSETSYKRRSPKIATKWLLKTLKDLEERRFWRLSRLGVDQG